MRLRRLVIISACVGCCALILCDDRAPAGQGQTGGENPAASPKDRREVIEALLKRSRLLENIHFRVPRRLWVAHLRSLAGPPPSGPAAAPVAAIRERGLYRVTVAADGGLSLEAEVHLRVFRPADVRGPGVLTGKVAWTDIRAAVNGGKPAAVALASSGRWLRYSPAAAGLHVIHTRATLSEHDGESLSLPIMRTVRTTLAFDSPRVLHVTDPSAPQSLTGAAGKGTRGTLALRTTDSLAVTYRPPVVLAEREARYQLRGPVAWNIDAGGQDVTARLTVTILAGRTDRLEVALPAGANRVSITGPDVREVRAAAGAATVHLRGRIGGQTALNVTFSLPAVRNHAAALAGLGIANGRWAGGTLVVTHSAGSREIMPAEASGLKELALVDIPRSAGAILTGRTALAYAITGSRWSAGVDVVDLGEFALRQTLADLAHYEVVYRPDGSVICKADYEIRNRNRQFLRISLPAGSTVLLARVNEVSRPVTPVGRGGDDVLLPLVRSKASVIGLVSFPVEIVFVCRAAAMTGRGTVGIELPRIDVPIAYAWAEAYLPETMTVSRWGGPMKRVDRYSSETATASMSYGRSELAEGYKRQDRFTPDSAEPAQAYIEPETAKKPKPRDGGGKIETADKSASRGGMSRGDRSGARDTGRTSFGIGGGGIGGGGGSMSRGVSLGRNYYRSGKELYEAKDLAAAERALSNVVRLAPNSPEADNAKRLLTNIKLARGKLALKGRAQKASGSRVLQDFQEGNRDLVEQQKQILDRGFSAIRQGKRGEALRQFQAAEALGKKLEGQGESQSEQSALLRDARAALDKAQREQDEKTRSQHARLKELRAKGEYTKALKLAERFKDEDVKNAPDAPEQKKLRRELGELAVLAAQRQAELRAGLQKALELERVYREREAEVIRDLETKRKLLDRYASQSGQAGKQPGTGRTTLRDDLRRPDPRLAQFGGAGQRDVPGNATEIELQRELRRAEERIRIYKEREAEAVRDVEKLHEILAGYMERMGPLDQLVKRAPPELKPRSRTTDRPSDQPPDDPDRPQGEDRGRGQGQGQGQPQRPAQVTQSYDVRDLLVSGFGKAGANDMEALARSQERRDRDLARLAGQAGEIAAAANDDNTVVVNNGRLVVTGDASGQDAVRKLIDNLRLARGPNVTRGEALSLQWAKDGQERRPDADKTRDADRLAKDKEFRKFVERNYGWQQWSGRPQSQPQAQAPGQGAGQLDVGTIAAKLRYNFDQKVQVGSINIAATADAANSLGVRFRTGNNGVTYTTIDEAQFRTLMQIGADNRGSGRVTVEANPNRQDTIVGTDALLANAWSANVTFSADAGNTIDINDNPVNLRHQDYILIDNGSYLTAVRAGRMQHWREQAKAIEFVEAPQDIAVPRVGRLVRFEKTLVRGDDRLVLTATYVKEEE